MQKFSNQNGSFTTYLIDISRDKIVRKFPWVLSNQLTAKINYLLIFSFRRKIASFWAYRWTSIVLLRICTLSSRLESSQVCKNLHNTHLVDKIFETLFCEKKFLDIKPRLQIISMLQWPDCCNKLVRLPSVGKYSIKDVGDVKCWW